MTLLLVFPSLVRIPTALHTPEATQDKTKKNPTHRKGTGCLQSVRQSPCVTRNRNYVLRGWWQHCGRLLRTLVAVPAARLPMQLC